MAHAAESLWQQALQTLPLSDQGFVSCDQDKTQILWAIAAAVEQKKRACLESRWKLKRGNKEIIIRDVLDKITARIRRFCDIGSIIVQYDPVHAALPWAGFLLLLQITIGDVEKFGALVDGLDKISSVLARYSLLEDIHLGSSNPSPLYTELKASLIRLYCAILRYLVKAKSYFSQSTGKRVIASGLGASESSVRLMLDIIFKKAAAVDSCLILIQSEASESLKSQTDRILGLLVPLEQPFLRTVAHVAELHDHLNVSKRLRILRWLSQASPKQHHRTEATGHLVGSGTWLFDHPEFAKWREVSYSSTLWLHGIPGCGKTKLVYSVIKRMLEEMDSSPTGSPEVAPVTFFYCVRNPAEPERSNPTEVARSILKQLAVTKRGLLKDVVIQDFQARECQAEVDCEDVEPLNLREAQALILKILEKDPATIIVDGLDECDEVTRFELLTMLKHIVQESASVVKVLIASRDDGDILQQLETSPNVRIRAEDNRADIHRFIDHSLDEAVASGRFLKGKVSDALKAEVSATLKEGANGMFRWATLHIDNLCDSRRIKVASDVWDEVGRLPKTLGQLYDVNYGRILQYARPSRIICQRILKWLMCAKRLMNTDDLIAAVTFASERHVLDQQSILDLCCNLVVVDENDFFRFAHLSVREFLESLAAYGAAECHAFVLQRCLDSYINTSGPPWTTKADTAMDWRIRPYSTLYWPEHCHGAIGTHTASCLDTQKGFVFGEDTSRGTYGEAFSEWLSEAWNSSQYSLAIQCDSITLERLASAAASQVNPGFVACAFDIAWILRSMDSVGLANLTDLRNYQDETCIQVAIKWKSWMTLRWLIANCPIDSGTQTDALLSVLECGHEDLGIPCKILLGGSANGFALTESHELNSALHYAVKLGLVEVVRLVLRRRQDFKPRTFLDCFYIIHESSAAEEIFTVFWETCKTLDSYQFFTVLLELNHDMRLKTTMASNAKARGIFRSMMDHSLVSEDLLLKRLHRLSDIFTSVFKDILVDEEDGEICLFKRLPTGYASENHTWTESATLTLIGLRGGHDVLSIVLDVLDLRSATPENPFEAEDDLPQLDRCQDGQGTKRTAEILMYLMDEWQDMDAVSEPIFRSIASVLFEKGIDANASYDEKGRTLLIMATKSSIHPIMRLLVEHGADLHQPDKKGQTPFMHAFKAGDPHSVKLLIELGLDVNGTTVDIDGRTPFELAVTYCCRRWSHDKGSDLLQYMRKRGARRPGASVCENGLSMPFLMATRPCFKCIAICLAPGPYNQDRQSGLIEVVDTMLEQRTQSAADTDSESVTSINYEQLAEQDGSLHLVKEKQEENEETQQQGTDSELCHPENESMDGLTLLRRGIENPPRAHRPIERLSNLLVPNMKLWEDGLTPLQLAIILEDSEMVGAILETSTDVNAVDDHGFSALHYAALSNNPWSMRQLLKKGANLGQQSRNGHTPLHMAVAKGGGILRLDFLMPHNPATIVDIEDINGNTALHLAVLGCGDPYYFHSGDKRIIEYLIRAGANINAQNGEGTTPLQLAVSKGMHLYWIDLFPVEVKLEDVFGDDDDPEAKAPVLQQAEGQSESLDTNEIKDATQKGNELAEGPYASRRSDRREVDLFASHGTATWTSLSGPDLEPLRAVDAVFRGASAFT